MSVAKQVKSKIRTAAHGEVFTAEREVKAMCDLVRQEAERVESCFLEPACGNGNFLAEVLRRKLTTVKKNYSKNAADYECFAERAVSSIYGIDILRDNMEECRKRLRLIWEKEYTANIKKTDAEVCVCRKRVVSILKKNILCGDALTMKQNNGLPIGFADRAFDVIIGNPPYQVRTRGSVESQATPVYNKFVEYALKMNPRFLVMITPARWFNGGFGLNKFRDRMLNDSRIRVIHDYLDAGDCFPGVQIKGGVCYFKWDRDNAGLCRVYTHRKSTVTESKRPLLEDGFSTFIRLKEAVSIIHKVAEKAEPGFSPVVSPRDPFGLNYYENGKEIMFKNIHREPFENSAVIYSQGWTKNGAGYVDRKYITTRLDLLDKYKVYISKAYGAGEKYPHQILNKPFLGMPGTCCNMTYLTIGGYDREETAENVISYMQTRFFRFLVSLLKNTQNAYRQVYKFVPAQDFSESWTDEELYVKYHFNGEEIAFIESMIHPMIL